MEGSTLDVGFIPQPRAALDVLASEISSCRLCDAFGVDVSHMPPINRGVPAAVLVIGVQPEKNDTQTLRPFSGAAGRQLFRWLNQAGIGVTDSELISRCYFTTLSKCYSPANRQVARATKICYAFLAKEIGLIEPKLCLTLGPEPLSALFKYTGPLENVVGRAWTEKTLGIELFGVFPADCTVVPLPSPSPSSRWLNDVENQERLQAAIAIVGERFAGQV